MSHEVKKKNPIEGILTEVRKVVVGYPEMTEKVCYTLFAPGGHVLLEAVWGLAKSVTANAFGRAIKDATWARFQMTPDMMPADIKGNRIYNRELSRYEIVRGPVFNNIVLADEINRTTPQTQSALLEPMAENSVSIAGQTFRVPELFCVLATQNPRQSEGTYPLPEPQLDRFLFKIDMGYVSEEDEERLLLNQVILKGTDPFQEIVPQVSVDEILAYRKLIGKTYVSPAARKYMLALVRGTRPGDKHFDAIVERTGEEGIIYRDSIEIGAGPRALQALMAASQIRAFHMGKNYVLPEHIQYIYKDVIRHRLFLHQKAILRKTTTPDKLIATALKGIPLLTTDEREYAPPA
ncbi:MAG: AAA family ATPase [Candidatus Melainabacteria bacterium]|jgi:MoxR-like ATPase|nr:AAA family ATPase [Candidatus Melainabacteria bacterium]